MEKNIRENEGSVERSDHYDFFFQLLKHALVKTALVYLEGIVPRHLLENYLLLISAAAANKGAVVLLRVLREFLFPRMSLRMTVRSNASAIMDWMMDLHKSLVPCDKQTQLCRYVR